MTHVGPGQRATVTVDKYPGKVFEAPVKLVFERGENAKHLLVPDMSVVPTVELR